MQASTSSFSVRLPAALRERLDKLASIRESSQTALVVKAITAFIDREELREALHQECIAAHEEYMRTGLHLTGAEVDGWIDQLLECQATDMPKCHV